MELADPHFYWQVAWWVWGISLWIGGGWCNAISDAPRRHRTLRQWRCTLAGNMLHIAQRVWDVRPAVTSANGVSAQAQRAQGQIPTI